MEATMTEVINTRRYTTESTLNQGRGKFYLFLGLVVNAVLWGTAFTYLIFAPKTYTSKFFVSLPGAAPAINVGLPGSGAASSQEVSPYSSTPFDPRSLYVFIAGTEPVVKAASNELNMSVEDFFYPRRPRLKAVEATTLIEFDVRGASPEEAQKKTLALYKALEARLSELRAQEAAQKEAELQNGLRTAQKKLEASKQRLAEYKASSGLVYNSQITQLTNIIENLGIQQDQIKVQQRETSARLKLLSANLNLSTPQALDAFTLKADLQFMQHLKEYNEASADLVNFSSKFTPSNPTVINQKARQDAARKALLARSQYLLGSPVSLGDLERNSLVNEDFFQRLVAGQEEERGLNTRLQALAQQRSQYEKRLTKLLKQESKLDELQRNVTANEAVFASTLGKLSVIKSTYISSYPYLQKVTEPTLSTTPSSPKPEFVLAGAALGSLFILTGLITERLRNRRNLKLERFKQRSVEG
jgi:uncharacterized protein involved in exopolysaccharide biosynthesis